MVPPQIAVANTNNTFSDLQYKKKEKDNDVSMSRLIYIKNIYK